MRIYSHRLAVVQMLFKNMLFEFAFSAHAGNAVRAEEWRIEPNPVSDIVATFGVPPVTPTRLWGLTTGMYTRMFLRRKRRLMYLAEGVVVDSQTASPTAWSALAIWGDGVRHNWRV